MAGSKSSVTGDDFYGAYDAQDTAKANADELGVQAVPSLNLVCNEEGEYVTAEEAKEKGMEIKKLSGTKFRQSTPPHTHQPQTAPRPSAWSATHAFGPSLQWQCCAPARTFRSGLPSSRSSRSSVPSGSKRPTATPCFPRLKKLW